MMKTSVLLIAYFVCAGHIAAQNISPASPTIIKQHLFGTTWTPASIDLSMPASLFPTETSNRKSVPLAVLYSMILPGMGEWYADRYDRGKYFTITEGALWLSYLSLNVYGGALRDDARSFARTAAGVNPSGKDDQYFVDIGNFISIDEYNEKRARDREPNRIYYPGAGYDWQWSSDDARASYKAQRISSDEMFNNQRFVVAALILNRVISAISAGRAAANYNKDLESSTGQLEISSTPLGGWHQSHGIALTIRKGI